MKIKTINFIQKETIKLIFLLSLFIFIIGCGDDDEKENYKVVSQMIVDRNKARVQSSANTKSSDITFEEKIKIVSQSSGKTISTGIAHIDNSGNIVKIIVKQK